MDNLTPSIVASGGLLSTRNLGCCSETYSIVRLFIIDDDAWGVMNEVS